MSNGTILIGTSGYQYDHWNERFYPQDLAKSEWLPYYCERFDTVEINNTFYHLPEEKTFRLWEETIPDGFCMTLKFSRYGSHLKCLSDPEDSIGNFMARAEILGDKLGPILVQLRPNWKINTDRLDAFLDVAPDSQRWAVELRNETWFCDEVYDVLRKHNAALCLHDIIEDHPRIVTADWVYLRFHGAQDEGFYPRKKLKDAATQIRDYEKDALDVYGYFNNDQEGNAIENARTLLDELA